MSNMIAWIAAEAERPKIEVRTGFPRRARHRDEQPWAQALPAHRIPVRTPDPTPAVSRAGNS